MKTQPIVPAQIAFDGDVPAAPEFGDVYHPRIGAQAQAEHVFLRGNGLPGRWSGRERHVVLELGFGLGNNFLATWDAWRRDPARCRTLAYVGIEARPPLHADLARALRSSPLADLAAELIAAWPPATAGLHAIDLDGGRVRLLLGYGDVAALLPELSLRADSFYLDGFAPARNPAMWEPRVLKALGRRAAPDATLATWSVARALREGLTAAGFEVELAPGIGGKREIICARHRPRHASRATAAGPPLERTAVVVGAGLAGAFCAQALARCGWEVAVLDRQPAPALETSGNPGGIFHGTVHGDDGPYAQLLRSAALLTARELRPLVDAGSVPGAVDGLLRLAPARDLAAMQALAATQGLPADWVHALSGADAGTLAGVTLPAPAWFFPGAGWADPGAWSASVLGSPGVRFAGTAEVRTLRRDGSRWTLLDRDGAPLASAPVVVLANADDAARLLASMGRPPSLRRVRGQVSGWLGAAPPLRLPVAGDGYALPLRNGLLCGATSAFDDAFDALRASDEAHNFERLRRLTGLVAPRGAERFGRVGWRVVADDRLPLAGPVPLAEPGSRADQARLWPRHQGLYVCSALGGRGITWAPLLGRLLAAQICGEPLPLPQGLVDAVDPARWLVRAARRASG